VDTKTKIMKTKILKFSLLTAILGIGLWSCNKEENSPSNNTLKIEKIFSNQKGTGLVNPKEFAELHNQYLFEALGYATTNDVSAEEALLMLNIPNIDDNKKTEIVNAYSTMTEQQMKNETFTHFIDPIAITHYQNVETILNNAIDLADLNNKLDIEINQINQNLNGSDWDIVMVYLETIRSSAYIWFSAERGGSGIGYAYAQTSLNHVGRDRPKWVSADGVGAGLGMASWSFSAFFGPVGWVGLLGATVYGAVTSSLASNKV